VTRVPLNTAGTGVQGTTASVTFDASAGFQMEVPVGFGPGPDAKHILMIDDNSNGAAGRMQLIDPPTLAVQPYAAPLYQGVGGETAGAYVRQLDRAVALDTLNDTLRSFAQGEGGAGTVLPVTGVSSACGSGEAAQLIPIERGATGCYANCDLSTTAPVLSVADFVCFLNRFSSGDTYANCDGSTAGPTLNIADFLCFLEQMSAGCP
jgi:hypothetical protein